MMMISAALAAAAGPSAAEPADDTVTMALTSQAPDRQVFVLEDIDGEVGCAHRGVLLWLCGT